MEKSLLRTNGALGINTAYLHTYLPTSKQQLDVAGANGIRPTPQQNLERGTQCVIRSCAYLDTCTSTGHEQQLLPHPETAAGRSCAMETTQKMGQWSLDRLVPYQQANVQLTDGSSNMLESSFSTWSLLSA